MLTELHNSQLDYIQTNKNKHLDRDQALQKSFPSIYFANDGCVKMLLFKIKYFDP